MYMELENRDEKGKNKSSGATKLMFKVNYENYVLNIFTHCTYLRRKVPVEGADIRIHKKDSFELHLRMTNKTRKKLL